MKRTLTRRQFVYGAGATAGLLALRGVQVRAEGIPIHGHPQLTNYPDPSTHPKLSAQFHWTPGENPPGSMVDSLFVDDLRLGLFGKSMIGHTHLDCQFPIYGVLDGPIVVPFTIKAFHLEGVIEQIEAYTRFGKVNDVARGVDWFWNDTQSSVQPILRGDPHGLRQWSGHVTIQPAVFHGWCQTAFAAFTQFDNGDNGRQYLVMPFYSPVDGPETHEGPSLSAQVQAGSPRRPEIQNGFTIVDIAGGYIPLAPIAKAWPMAVSSLGYGSLTEIPFPATLQERVDLDLHNGIAGRKVAEVSGAVERGSPVSMAANLDPVALGGPGTHKVAFIRTQPDGGLEGVASLLVIDVTVDPNAPAPVDPPPPPPPPPAPPASRTCSGTVNGTSDGTTITLTGGTIRCS